MDAGLSLLCDGLQQCSTLFHLNLAKNDLTQTGMERFGPILSHSGIKELDLSLNPLGNGGVRILAENLWDSKNIHDDDSAIGESFPTEVYEAVQARGKRCNLIKLDLSETKIQEVGAFNLCKLLLEFYKIEHLTLEYNYFEVQKMPTFT